MKGELVYSVLLVKTLYARINTTRVKSRLPVFTERALLLLLRVPVLPLGRWVHGPTAVGPWPPGPGGG